MEIKDLLMLLWHNVRFLILGLLAGFLVGLVAAQIETPVYESTTKILVSRTREQSSADMLPLSDDQLLAINLQLVKSQPVLEEASKQLGTRIDPDYVQVSAIPNSLMIQIKAQDPDPKRAAAIANLLVQILIQQNQTLLAGRYSAFEDAISSQIDQVQIQIRDLQTEINQMSDATVQEQLTKVNQQVDQLKTQIAAVQDEIAAYPENLTPIQRASMSEKLAQLDQMNSLMSIYGQIQANLTYTGKPAQNGSTRDNPALTALQSTLELYQQMHLQLLNDRESVDLARRQSAKNVVPLVPAVPTKQPVRPLPLLYVLLGAVVGSALAATGILLVDHLDQSLRTVAQTEKSLGISVLGSVIDTPPTDGHVVVLSAPFSPEASAFRVLGASVELVCAKKDIRTLMIANAGPKDNKTRIAANLAVINAQQGRQVILVDGDIRHPRVHKAFGLPNEKGLAEIRYGQLNPKGVLQSVTGLDSLKVIAAGAAEENAPEWLDARKLAAFVAELKKQSDLVIVDGPSVAIADAQVFASTVDAVVLAIYTGHTHLGAAQDTLQKFQLIGAKVLGAVLNGRAPSRISKNLLAWATSKLHRSRKEAYEEKREANKAPVSMS